MKDEKEWKKPDIRVVKRDKAQKSAPITCSNEVRYCLGPAPTPGTQVHYCLGPAPTPLDRI